MWRPRAAVDYADAMKLDDARVCRILLVSGSLRTGSSNAAVLRTLQAVAPPGVAATIYTGLAELPHFSPDDDAEPLPVAVATLRHQLAQSDGVMFSTPEYAGSLPGSFKNWLDWTVGEGLHRKPVGYTNASAHGAAQGAHATLRVVLGYVNADIVEDACVQLPVRRDAVTADGTIHDVALRERLTAALTALASHIAARRADLP